jgi:hypothetical protein
LVFGKMRLAARELGLDCQCAGDGQCDAGELGENRVACVVFYFTVVVFYAARESIETIREKSVGSRLIRFGEPAIARDIGIQDYRQLSL